MILNRLVHIVVGMLLVNCVALEAAQSANYRGQIPASSVGDSSRENLSILKRELKNQAEELSVLKERLGTLDNQIEQLNREHQEELSASREQIKQIQKKTEEKNAALEKTVLTLIADLKQLHDFSQRQLTREEQQREKLETLEQLIAAQQKNQDHLHSASQKLAEAFAASVKENENTSRQTTSSLGTGTYQVQSGDSLERIARRYQMTVQQLKEMNNISMEKDRIIVGQILKVPVNIP